MEKTDGWTRPRWKKKIFVSTAQSMSSLLSCVVWRIIETKVDKGWSVGRGQKKIKKKEKRSERNSATTIITIKTIKSNLKRRKQAM